MSVPADVRAEVLEFLHQEAELLDDGRVRRSGRRHHGAVVNFTVPADARAVGNQYVGRHSRAVADLCVGLDNGERPDGHVLAQSGVFVNQCGRMYVGQ